MLFIAFSYLIALSGISSATLNGSSESGWPCLVPDLEEKLQSLNIEYEISCVLYINGFYYV